MTYLRGWPRVKWWASPLLFWDDFSDDGQLGPEAAERNAVGSICMQREIAPGAEAEYTFVLAWHFPNRTPAWCGWTAPQGEENTIIGNYYCQRFRDAWQAAEYAAANLKLSAVAPLLALWIAVAALAKNFPSSAESPDPKV